MNKILYKNNWKTNYYVIPACAGMTREEAGIEDRP